MSKRRELANLRAAAKAGDMAAAGELSEILLDDDDLAGAEYWSRMAAPSGNPTAKMVLGIVLSEKGNDEEGTSLLKAAASSKDPQFAETAGEAASVLLISLLQRASAGQVRVEQKDLDEAENWMEIAEAAGYGVPQDGLELLERARRGEVQGGASQGSGSDVLQTFEVDSVMFYDGSGHRLGRSVCTLTRTRLIIDDARGGISQILLRDITGVSSPLRKQLRITAPGVAYDIYCLSKDQKNDFGAWLSEAIRG
jgi:hypothetical protein